MSHYMEFEGIEGPVTAKDFVGMIEVVSHEWGAGRAVPMTTGRKDSGEAGVPSFSEMRVQVPMDTYSVMFFQHFLGKGSVGPLTIYETKTEDGKTKCFKETKIEKVHVTAYHERSSGGQGILSLCFSWKDIELRQSKRDEDSKTGEPVSAGFSIGDAEAR